MCVQWNRLYIHLLLDHWCTVDIVIFNPQQKLTEEKYEVQSCIPEAAILVCAATEPKLTLKVTLTSPKMRDDAEMDEQGLCLCVTEPRTWTVWAYLLFCVRDCWDLFTFWESFLFMRDGDGSGVRSMIEIFNFSIL